MRSFRFGNGRTIFLNMFQYVISRNLKFEEFPIWKWSNNLFKYVSVCSSLLFYICLCFLFLSRESLLKITTKFCILIFLLINIFQVVFEWLCSLLVMLWGDVEVNPGPKMKDKYCVSIRHWNFNSLWLFQMISFKFI